MPAPLQRQPDSLEEATRGIAGRFRAGNRPEAWELAAQLLPPGDPYRRVLTRFRKTLDRWEKVGGAMRVLPHEQRGLESPPRASTERIPGHPRKRTKLLKGSPEAKRFMWSMRQRYRARLSWSSDRWLDPDEKRRRMEPCWRARRKAKDDHILASIHPHVRRVLGDREILRRHGR